MREPRISVDTSVFGGCFDPEFEKRSIGLFQEFDRGIWLPVIYCVEMVREARDRINNEIKNFSIPEKIAWFTQQTKAWEESRKLGRNLKKSKAA